MNGPCFFHVDLDAFFAAVEQKDDPALKGKPVIIGATPGTRGVVSACSYEARVFGVRSAMPISEAFRRCPQGVYLPVRMERYQEVSQEVMELLGSFSPGIQQISIDEAFLDMSGTRRLFGDEEAAAGLIKTAVKEKLDLTLSVGIAPNRYLAKLASDFKKPDGLWRVVPGKEEDFLDRLKLKELWGVGGKTLEKLTKLNIRTVPELRCHSLEDLRGHFGSAAGLYLFSAARGIDPGIMPETAKSRSLSHETTFREDVDDREILENVLLELAHQVMFRMIRENLRSRTVSLKLRLSDFSTFSAQVSLQHFVSSAEELFLHGRQLFNKRWDGRTPVRLVGLGFNTVEKNDRQNQGELFEDPFEKKKKVETAVLSLNQKGNRITKASFLE